MIDKLLIIQSLYCCLQMIYLRTPSIDTFQARLLNFKMIIILIFKKRLITTYFHTLLTFMFYTSKYVYIYFLRLPNIFGGTLNKMIITLFVCLYELIHEIEVTKLFTYLEHQKYSIRYF